MFSLFEHVSLSPSFTVPLIFEYLLSRVDMFTLGRGIFLNQDHCKV